MQQLKTSNYPSNAFGRFWMKVPLVLRSILIGFGVSSLGVGIWTIVAMSLPGPWSVLLMATILIFFWMYFSGKWKPSNTQAFRRFCIRQINLKKPVWIWGLVAAFFIVLFLHSSWILTFRIVEFQPEIFKTLSFINDVPALQAWSAIIGISMVAGICEEVGYRGYLQKPLEQKYGPIVAISISSIIFIVIHLHQAWLVSILVPAFFISFMIGYLAYATNSLIPGIMAHVTFDIINVSYWWSDVMGTFERKPISVTGVDNHFIITVIVVLLSTLLFIIAIRKLLKLKDVALQQTIV
ncbi:CPBP family intramembrane glutamic endopeptidase [uncultured Eudoraea sp.]|jgi:membrane protease YdiL (CAAX protease family)|uniref:CPBP family intramembrane glutamic endopeptidase n=1 Tax=uncultured Eudoraea sp. TaxID=1035614 RepID=UPI002627116F|nr:type II CAAX endopeptidase family protein [uncultured Eudoraea sp.]